MVFLPINGKVAALLVDFLVVVAIQADVVAGFFSGTPPATTVASSAVSL